MKYSLNIILLKKIKIKHDWFITCLKSLDEGKIDDGGVVGLNSGDGFKEAQLLKGASNGERSQRVVDRQKSGPSEPHAVKAHGLYFLRN